MNIKFYGAHDLSSGWQLKEIEEFFQRWDEKIHEPDLNTILVLYNIKKYMDAGMQRLDWTDEQFSEYQNQYPECSTKCGKAGSGRNSSHSCA